MHRNLKWQQHKQSRVFSNLSVFVLVARLSQQPRKSNHRLDDDDSNNDECKLSKRTHEMAKKKTSLF